jgi:tetratricopeptide (TPR) repeat protein
MQAIIILLIRVTASAALLWMASACGASATGTEPAKDPQVDPGACLAAATASDGDSVIAVCGALAESEKTLRPDRIRALTARAAAYARKDQLERAISDYDAALRLDPAVAEIFNARGELWLRKGDRPRALADFEAAMKLDPQHEAARNNHKSLARELERLGAQMAIKNKGSSPAK